MAFSLLLLAQAAPSTSASLNANEPAQAVPLTVDQLDHNAKILTTMVELNDLSAFYDDMIRIEDLNNTLIVVTGPELLHVATLEGPVADELNQRRIYKPFAAGAGAHEDTSAVEGADLSAQICDASCLFSSSQCKQNGCTFCLALWWV
ncbi:Uu.00g138030.m01.CDS01 [Anthostomella pinea]|uniref:Uu.00g138030.m01.CDS01 n=1 Tax=Anthostomella pinea TaxID=933095 RepID=A0AAI8YL48_9PEZI|nr:Uu.00g138030.m01.CDS01 [Anthostomella pinea]